MLVSKQKGCLRNWGSSIIETAAGLFLLVSVALFLVDLISLVLVQTGNDQLAKQAARAAAETPDPNPGDGSAQNAAQRIAQQIVDAFPSSQLSKNPTLIQCTYTDNPSTGVSQVYVRTQVTCVLPISVPFNGISQCNFVAEATEPIVAVLSPSISAGTGGS